MESKNNLIVEKIEKWLTIFFFCISIFVVIFLTQALLLTWLNQFKTLYILACFAISFLLIIIFFLFIKKDIKILPRLNILFLITVSFVCLVFIFFPHDVFGGRDEGLYANLAVYLTNHGHLNTPPYLNPNPSIVQSWTGRVPAYTTWLAIQNMFFGQNWMLRSSVVPVALGLIYLYLVASFIGGRKVGLITIILYISCLPFLWLARETLSENLAFFLLWFLVLSLILFFKTKRNIYLGSLFITGWLFSFARIEGIYIQITALLAFVFIALITKITSLKKTVFIFLIYLFLIASTFLIYDHVSDKKYLDTNISVVTNQVTNEFSFKSVNQNQNIRLIDKIPAFIMLMMAKYNLLLVLSSILLITLIFFFNKKNCFPNKIYFIGLLIIFSPEFVKVINPGISLDQPWFFRRYIYALIPLGYFCLSMLLNKIVKHRLLVTIIIGLFIINIVFSSNIITLKNNWSLTKAIETTVKDVTKKDFVILKSHDILSNWYNPAIYLSYQKEIRTLPLNWVEIKNWLPKEKIFEGVHYDRLYLLSDNESENYKNFRLAKINTVKVEYKQLQFNCYLALLNKKLGSINLYNDMLLPYLEVINYCNETDNQIFNVRKNIFLYELFFQE